MRDNPPKLNSPNNLTNPPRSSSCRYEEIPRTHPVEMIVSFSFPKVTAGLRWLVVCGYPSDRAGNPVDILRVQVFRQHERNMRAKSMLIQKRTRRGHIGDIGSSERTSSMSRMSFRGWRISRAIEPKFRSLCVKVEWGGGVFRQSSVLAESHAEVATGGGSFVFDQLAVVVDRYSGLS